MSERPHVLVVGGGPGGATAAAILANEGARVTLLERERFPRAHVGESLQPAGITLLETHLGLAGEIAARGFPRKYGATYVWGETRTPWSVLFDARLDEDLPSLPDEAALHAGGYEHAFNVDRALFDDVILRAAIRAGVEVRENVEARTPVIEDGRVVGAVARDEHGREERVLADVVIDASGQRCWIGRALRLAEDVEDMRATATYTYFDGAGGAPGVLGRNVQMVVSIDEGWVWFIPISATCTSVGIVTRNRERMREQEFDRLLARAELPLAGARAIPDGRGQRLRFARDWSYACSRFAGEGFILVGDAACFVDPILSGGVDFAIRMGCRAALAIVRGLGEEGTTLSELFAAYEAQMRREYRAYLRLARYWYGNNRSVEGLFWEAHKEIPPDSVTTPLRAFVYLTTGKLAADQHLRVFQQWQEQRMFRQLGVDDAALRRAWRARRGAPEG